METLERDGLVNLFDMLMHRMDDIETRLNKIDEHMKCRQRYDEYQTCRMDGSLFSPSAEKSLWKLDADEL